MADIVWPLALPQVVQRGDWREVFPDVIKRTPMDYGPDKTRPRVTRGLRMMTITVWCDDDGVTIFKTFYREVAQQAANWFGWVHPRTGAAVDMKFANQPTVTPVSSLLFKVQFQVQILDPAPAP